MPTVDKVGNSHERDRDDCGDKPSSVQMGLANAPIGWGARTSRGLAAPLEQQLTGGKLDAVLQMVERDNAGKLTRLSESLQLAAGTTPDFSERLLRYAGRVAELQTAMRRLADENALGLFEKEVVQVAAAGALLRDIKNTVNKTALPVKTKVIIADQVNAIVRQMQETGLAPDVAITAVG